MPEHVSTQEWRRSNETTHYPFSNRATLTNATGTVILEGALLDAALYPVGAETGLYLSRVEVTHEDVTLWVGVPGEPSLASGTFSLADPDGEVALADPAGRPAGVLVSEPTRLVTFQAMGVGEHEFTPAQTEFCATVHFPTPEVGVRGFVLEDGTVLTGDVWLVGSDGVVLRTERVALAGSCAKDADTVDVIRVDVVGDPLFRRRLCADAGLFQTPRPVKAIRVVGPNQTFDVTPDEFGDVKLTVGNNLVSDTVLRVSNGDDGITIGAAGTPTYAG